MGIIALAGMALGLFWFWIPVVWLIIPAAVAAAWMACEVRTSRCFGKNLAVLLVCAFLVRLLAALANGVLAERYTGVNEPWDLVPDGSVYVSYGYYLSELMTGRAAPEAYKILVHRLEHNYAWPGWTWYQVTGMSYWNGLWFSVFATTPVAIWLMNGLASLLSAVLLFRFLRHRYDERVAVLGFGALLFYPTLVLWSASGSKESLVVLSSVIFLLALNAFLTWPMRRRHLGLGMVLGVSAIAAYFLRSYIAGLLAITALLTMAGRVVAGIWGSRRWWARIGLIAVLALAATIGWERGTEVMERLYQHSLRRSVANYYVDPIGTTGYRIYPQRYYERDYVYLVEGNALKLSRLTWTERASTAARALARFFFSPYLGDVAQSRILSMLYPLALLNMALCPFVMVGCWRGLQKDPALLPLMGFMLVVAFVVGLHNGNVGTVVRIKDMVMPFYLVLAAVGIGEVMNWRPNAGTLPLI